MYINIDNNENKKLMILTYQNNIHCNTDFFNNIKIDFTYEYDKNRNNLNRQIFQNEIQTKSIDNYKEIKSSKNKIKNINELFISTDFTKLSLNDIINYYDHNEEKGDNLADIY